MADMKWLKTHHELYDRMKDTWRTNERRLEGGNEIVDMELHPFDWENTGTEVLGEKSTMDRLAQQLEAEGSMTAIARSHYEARKQQATYVNFPDMFATVMVGHLMRNAPTPESSLNFGTLGKVPRERSTDNPSDAELVYYNVDGVGNDGSQWDNFWSGALRRAMATGHRWILVEAPPDTATNRAEAIKLGIRPYLTELSPLSVINWHFQHGRLEWAVLEYKIRSPKLVRGSLTGNKSEIVCMLMVREGWEGFGEKYKGGGWWVYDDKGKQIDASPWDATGGDIPLFPLYYQRHPKKMSRPALTELGNVAVSYMNLSSAADWDAWDAAVSFQFIIGVDPKAFQVAIEKMKAGSRFIPLQSAGDGPLPEVHDSSTGAIVADVFNHRLRTKREEARELAALEATSVPESSGASKRAGFSEAKAPRLASIASELEQAQNTAIHFLERRFDNDKPSGSVKWARKFELIELIDEIQTIFALERMSGLRSPTVEAKAMFMAVSEKGMVGSDDEGVIILKEYEKSANSIQKLMDEGKLQVPDIGPAGMGSLLPSKSITGADGRVESANADTQRSVPRGS